MGTTPSRPNERFNVDTISYIVQANKSDMIALQKRFHKLLAEQRKSHRHIPREVFEQACKDCNIKASDKDVMSRLFILCDKTGMGEVDYKELLIVMSPIVKGTIEDKIRLGLRMMDEGDTHMLKRDDLEFALRAMNRTLIFFGDTKLSDDKIEEIIDSIFDTVQLEDGKFKYLEHMNLLAYHPIIETLLRT